MLEMISRRRRGPRQVAFREALGPAVRSATLAAVVPFLAGRELESLRRRAGARQVAAAGSRLRALLRLPVRRPLGEYLGRRIPDAGGGAAVGSERGDFSVYLLALAFKRFCSVLRCGLSSRRVAESPCSFSCQLSTSDRQYQPTAIRSCEPRSASRRGKCTSSSSASTRNVAYLP